MSKNLLGHSSDSLLNKCKIPRIPPLLVADEIIIDCKEKAKLFNDYFLDQCKPIINDSTLPIFTQITCSNLDTIAITQKSILDITKILNVNKAILINVAIRLLCP